MRLLEYQSKLILSQFGLNLSESAIVEKAEAARHVADRLGGGVVLKAQVPFGGRAKAGAVLFAESGEEAEAVAKKLIGMDMCGVRVEKISVEAKLKYEQELYAGITWDNLAKRPVVILSSTGGVNVESDFKANIAKQILDPDTGLRAFQGREMAKKIGLKGKIIIEAGAALEKLSSAFLSLDAVTVEINPLVVTGDNTLIGLDAHLEIDDDAVYRQSSRLKQVGDLISTPTGRPPTTLELKAQQIDSMDHRGVAGRVVEFDGDLCLLIGGGGASLTVFDAVRRHGGRPANYCEVGGNPTEEKVAALTELLLSKPGVSKMAVIMNVVNNTRADVMARGVVAGIKRAGRVPAETISVFRIPGSWEQEAHELLAAEGVKALGREYSLDACAKLAVEKLNAPCC